MGPVTFERVVAADQHRDTQTEELWRYVRHRRAVLEVIQPEQVGNAARTAGDGQ
jgi:hypothetical protein